jgi:hypothetical protein
MSVGQHNAHEAKILRRERRTPGPIIPAKDAGSISNGIGAVTTEEANASAIAAGVVRMKNIVVKSLERGGVGA